MNKTKIAICMKDLEYQRRFVNCFMNHYNHQYELHVFTNSEQLLEAKPKEYTVIITEEYSTEEMAEFVEKGDILACMMDGSEKAFPLIEEDIVYIYKYQEVYRIAEVLERVLVDRITGYRTDSRECGYNRIGVYSFAQELYQAPFAALLAKVLGEHGKVLVIDLQPYSGLCNLEEGMTSMGLEDLLSVVMTGNYSRSRILECIRHEAEWDYVCAAQNQECLAEGTEGTYDSLVTILAKELGYQTIILNFGAIFTGQIELMEKCHTIYLLCEKERESNWREEAFFQRLLQQDKNELIQKIKKIPLSASRENTWQALSDKWNWSSLGDLLRLGQEKENG